jgi:anthranilate synthase component 1
VSAQPQPQTQTQTRQQTQPLDAAHEVPDLTLGGTWPSLDTFRLLARDRRVIPVVRRFLADGETPIGVYRKLADDRPGSFLLESAEHGIWARWSIVGAASRATLTALDGRAHWLGEPPVGVPTDGDPLHALRDTVAALSAPRLPGLPPLTGGMVGFLAWDVVRRWERLPDTTVDELGVPELSMSLATDLAVLDHSDGTVLLVANAVNYDATDERVDEAWADAVARLDVMTGRLAEPAPSTVAVHGGFGHSASGRSGSGPGSFGPGGVEGVLGRSTQEEYVSAVREGKAAIRDGEVFQVVLSQRFDLDCPADALDVYRVLRASNPSPYMYLYRAVDPAGRRLDVVGSSPEALVTVRGARVITHPIAGTRPRGGSVAQDAALAEELLGDAKERAEHLMLVDLSRNDLGRVCVPGSVEVVDFMDVERYSHVMHLVSTVEGDLAPGRTAYDVLQATFPAGTLSGAPKPRAMEIIDKLEPVRRGLYGGVVGYLDVAGDMDFAIAIRTALLRDGVAHVQAGAGIVADSVPARTRCAVTRRPPWCVRSRPRPPCGRPSAGPARSPRPVGRGSSRRALVQGTRRPAGTRRRAARGARRQPDLADRDARTGRRRADIGGDQRPAGRTGRSRPGPGRARRRGRARHRRPAGTVRGGRAAGRLRPGGGRHRVVARGRRAGGGGGGADPGHRRDRWQPRRRPGRVGNAFGVAGGLRGWRCAGHRRGRARAGPGAALGSAVPAVRPTRRRHGGPLGRPVGRARPGLRRLGRAVRRRRPDPGLNRARTEPT